MDYVELGHRIRQQRYKRDMTQQKLAEKSGISASFLGHIERGSRKASLETLIGICNALEIGADVVLLDSLPFAQGGGQIRIEQANAFIEELASRLERIMTRVGHQIADEILVRTEIVRMGN